MQCWAATPAVCAATAGASLAALLTWPAFGNLDQIAGKALFERQWVPAPATTDAADGLGPLFNARSCSNCHKNGGPARVIERTGGTQELQGAVIRFGDAEGKTDPHYGLQLQTDAIPGLQSEGRASFIPTKQIELLGPPLSEGIQSGVRSAPSLLGRAAFEFLSDETIRDLADPDDKDRNGISGRVRELPQANGGVAIGRFGWKAAHASVTEQIAHAFAIDLGLSSPIMPVPSGDCTALQRDCLARPNGESKNFDGREISLPMLTLVADYLISLKPPPVPPDEDARQLFTSTGCSTCHVPALPASDGKPVRTYSDFLLHDMGPDLDDGVGEPGVKSSEWRTAPLIDMAQRNGTRRYLHDGRATSVAEAIEAHGGEGTAARDAFLALPEGDRQRLLSYIEAL